MTEDALTFNAAWKIIFGSTKVGIDLTDKTAHPLKWQTIYDRDGTGSDNDYDYLSESLPETETFKFMEGRDYDGQIKYVTAYCNKGENKDHNVLGFSTDFSYVLYAPQSISDEGYCLIAVDGAGKLYRRLTGIRWLPGTTP